jgi:NDP-sugar pyrophosphorylase family protein
LGDRFLTLYGDSYLTCDYRAAAEAFLASGQAALMTVYRNEGQWDSSNVEFENGRIVNYDKKNRTSEMHYIDYGLGGFHRSVFDGLLEDTPVDLADVYRSMLREGRLFGWEVRERFYEIGSFAGIQELTEYLSR